MNFSVIQGNEITSKMVERWCEIQKADKILANPYFHPDFTRLVASIRSDVFVGILKDGNRIKGFFPFQRGRGGAARPVGLGLSDYHGVIASKDAVWTADELLRGCKLIRWEFDHLPIDQQQFNTFHVYVSDSPIIDVSQGLTAYEASRDKAGRKQLREARRKREKLANSIGPISFTMHSKRKDILRQMMCWKSQQCQTTGTVDYFAMDWCVQLIDRIHDADGPDFGGFLSCLHAGDTLAAVHFAMYSHNVCHSWFPVYNHDLKKYSPGFILLLEIIEAASELGIKHIDLGKGLSMYKKRVMTNVIPVAQGCVEIPTLSNSLRHLFSRLEDRSRNSILMPVFRGPGRMIKMWQRKKKYE